MWVYIQSEPGLYTVGFYDPKGEWHPDSDYVVRQVAAQRTHWLNGGGPNLIDAYNRVLGELNLAYLQRAANSDMTGMNVINQLKARVLVLRKEAATYG